MQRRPFPFRIDRYIFGQLFVALALVTTGLVALIWLTQSLRFIQIIVNHGLSPLVFVKLTLLLVPSFLATILPITCFIVVLFIYARLAGDRELTVMRATGLSDLALARPALALAVAAMLCGYVLNLAVVPVSLNVFRQYEFEIRNQIAAFLLQPGVFTPVADHVTVYVQSRGEDDSLSGIIIEDGRDPTASATILARTGQLMISPQGPVVLLQDGSREQVDPKTGQLDTLTFKRNVVSLAQAAKAGTPDMTDAAEAPLAELLHPSATLTNAEQAKWLVEAQRRLTAPFATLSYTLIGLLATLRGVFRRHGGLVRPAGAVATVTLLVAVNLGVNNLAARNLDLLPMIWVAVLVPGLLAAVLLFCQAGAAMMAIPFTLSLYFGRQFAAAVLAMLLALAALVSLFDFLELLRESATAPAASFGIIVEMEFLRGPWTLLQILPFAVLLGGIYAFWRLSRSSELVVARAAGISAWQFLALPVLLATFFGVFGTGAVSPLSAVMYGRAETLYNAYLKNGGGPLSLNGGELWVRQADAGLVPDGVAVLHAGDVRLHDNVLRADHVTILRLSDQTLLLQRLEASHATLDAGAWELSEVDVLQPGAAPRRIAAEAFPTDLTVHRVQESFASPDSLSFWALPGFIQLLKRSGFSPIQHELAFQALAALPLLCATMALVAAGFSMRPSRRGGAGNMLVSGVGCGFALFMISEVANQFGTSGAVPVILAAWAPAVAGLFLALALLLHLEDG